MDRRAGACGASFLPFSPSFQCLSSAFRTDSFVLPISDPLTGLIDGETRLGAKVKGAIPKVGRFKARVCQTKGGNLSIWATNLYAEAGGAKTGKGGCNEAERPRDCCSEASCKTQEVKKGAASLATGGAFHLTWF
jgi:hypothetical protein